MINDIFTETMVWSSAEDYSDLGCTRCARDLFIISIIFFQFIILYNKTKDIKWIAVLRFLLYIIRYMYTHFSIFISILAFVLLRFVFVDGYRRSAYSMCRICRLTIVWPIQYKYISNQANVGGDQELFNCLLWFYGFFSFSISPSPLKYKRNVDKYKWFWKTKMKPLYEHNGFFNFCL